MQKLLPMILFRYSSRMLFNMPTTKLTTQQREAVMHDGNLLLTACPGSGKTRTLVSKLAHKLDQINLGKRYLAAITYTNVAADTILERLNGLDTPLNNLWVGTIHSFCLEWVIKPHKGLHSRISTGYRIIDEYESQDILDSIKTTFSVGAFDKIPLKLNEDWSTNKVGYTEQAISAALEYHAQLQREKLIDFDLILNISLTILLQNPEIGLRLSNLFESCLIDEYQDTNQFQYSILREIIKHGNCKVCLIGDVDQAIYTGLGAIVKNHEEICTEFNLTSIDRMTLTGCYRSKQHIIDFYSKFQESSYKIESKQKTSFSNETLNINNTVTKGDLAQYIATIINTYLKQDIPPEEIAVLSPSWYEVTSLGRSLSTLLPGVRLDAPGLSPIPFSKENVWFKLIRLSHTSINSKNYYLRYRLAKEIIQNLSDLELNIDTSTLTEKRLLKMSNTLSTPDSDILTYINKLISSYCSLLDISFNDSIAPTAQYKALIQAVAKRLGKEGVEDNSTCLPKYFNEGSGIKITTCHSTKGEEYQVVICTGLLEGKVPHWDDIYKKANNQAAYMSRRLLYVICSRAKGSLFLISESNVYTRGNIKYIPTKQLTLALAK